MCYPGIPGYPSIQEYISGWISSSQGPGYYPDYLVPKSAQERSFGSFGLLGGIVVTCHTKFVHLNISRIIGAYAGQLLRQPRIFCVLAAVSGS
jgi:hypothetical protein